MQKKLHAIEDAFIKERQELLDKYNREWTGKLEERRHKEVNQSIRKIFSSIFIL